ncbi:MAG: PaaI family thioesterase [Salaquimonas sp.]
MSAKSISPVEEWLAISATHDPAVYKIDFQEHHIGNPIIRSVHGGVVGSLIEFAAEGYLTSCLEKDGRICDVEVTTSSIDYLRVTKDAPLFAKAEIVRIARRIAFIDVWVWQDSEDLLVSRGACTLRIVEKPSEQS